MVWEQNTEDFPDADGPACRMAFPTKEQYSTEPRERMGTSKTSVSLQDLPPAASGSCRVSVASRRTLGLGFS